MIPLPVLASAILLTGDYGGAVTEYLAATWETRPRTIIVMGDCASACSIAVDREASRVCLEPSARLGFHRGVADGVETDLPLYLYRPQLQRWIRWHGGLPPPRLMLWMDYGQARRFWRACTPADWRDGVEYRARLPRPN